MRERLIELLEPVVRDLGFELWDLEYAARRGNGFLRLYIDVGVDAAQRVDNAESENEASDQGIDLEDCAVVSRAVSALLDERDPIPVEYTLEVSSPGMDRVLRTAAHFARFIGERAQVEMTLPVNGRRKFLGKLLALNANELSLEQDGVPVLLPFSGINTARLAPEFA
ncbi:MAG: ribosome maturation factor RimP [Steroidobacteraceae bacterium]